MSRIIPNPSRASDDGFETLVAEATTAMNAHDGPAFAALFAPDGRVVDDRTEVVGWVAISQWFQSTLPIVLETVDVRLDGGTWTLIANGYGDYPESPSTLRYDFVLSDAGIDSMTISLADLRQMPSTARTAS